MPLKRPSFNGLSAGLFTPRRWRAVWSNRRSAPSRSTDTKIPRLPADPAGTIRHYANPGPLFEQRETPDHAPLDTRAKTVAFYLPQFHPFEENNTWWGEGFTEWRNVSRGTPRFQGHYQPRIPRDLGFYDLRDETVIKAQSALARAAGISAFCFYYYWFNGRRLMEKPLDIFVRSDIDQEFCIMWANENWTRRWDGRENDVLIAQDYEPADEHAFLEDTARYMAHPRYLRVDGRPLFILYRASLIPDTASTIARWRQQWRLILGIEPLIYMAQSYDDRHPGSAGCDGAIEFPPHKVSRNIKRQNRHYRLFDPDYRGQIRHYSDLVSNSLNEPAPPYPLIKTVSPSWDNDARREGAGVSFHGSTPDAYQRWLSGAIDHAVAHPTGNQPLVFINAWNEWAEAAYLEPDVHYGHAYLNATHRALTERRFSDADPVDLLLAGHDAHANGAQMLLLALARIYRYELGLNVVIVLKAGGKLLPSYQAVAPTHVIEADKPEQLAQLFSATGARKAIFNTAVTGDLLFAARQANLRCLCLVHELPSLIEEYGLQHHIDTIAQLAHTIVFPSHRVHQGFLGFSPRIHNAVCIRPQGLYKTIQSPAGARSACRQSLGLARSDQLVLNVGYADHRKGFDLFIQAAQRLCPAHPDLHFCWVGKRSARMKRWLRSGIGRKLRKQLHIIDFSDAIAPFFCAADVLYLSSREDPFPSVVLEAMSLGKPVLLHAQATGFDQPVLSLNYQAAIDAPKAIDEALWQALTQDTQKQKQARIEHIQRHFQIEDYANEIWQQLNHTPEETSDSSHKVAYL